jgi:ComF family protein
MPWSWHIKRRLKQVAQRGGNLIYPPQCAYCGEGLDEASREKGLCEDCRKRLVPPLWTPCPRCGGTTDQPMPSPEGCISCLNTPFAFDGVVALGNYHSSLNTIIFQMKMPVHASLAQAVGKLLAAERLEELQKLQIDAVVPIPMHWRNRFWRGVNSPELLAHSLSEMLEIPLQRHSLVRWKRTRTQSELTPKERFSNVRGAFRVRFAQKIRGRRILLVDDVLTTGATCSEAAKMLKHAGAAAVAVAVVARAQGENR